MNFRGMVQEQISAEGCFFILTLQLLAVGPIAVSIFYEKGLQGVANALIAIFISAIVHGRASAANATLSI